MSRLSRSLSAGAALLALAAGPAAAQSGAKAEAAIAFVRSALDHIEAVGEDRAFKDFSTVPGPWLRGEYYIFCHTLDGISVAHGGNPGLRGKKVLGFRDPGGLLVNQLILDKVKAEGKGWVRYEWPNPVTNKVAPKYIYSEKVHDKFVCGSGYYE